MKHISLSITILALASALTGCAENNHTTTTTTTRTQKKYSSIDAPLGSHVRRSYAEGDAPPVTGVSAAAGAGERPFLGSAAGGGRMGGGTQ